MCDRIGVAPGSVALSVVGQSSVEGTLPDGPYLAQWMRGIDDPVSALKSKPFGFESMVARLFVHMGPVRHAERRWFVLQQIRRCAQNAKATT